MIVSFGGERLYDGQWIEAILIILLIIKVSMNNLSLRQLRAFMAVARNRSFVAAAKELFITPPALSDAIRQLEQVVGVKLFDRTTRSVEVTAAGEEFFADVDRLLASLDGTVMRMRDIGSGHRGLARIIGVASILARLAAPCMARLVRSHPGISFDVIEDGTDRCLSAVLDGSADVGICVVPERPVDGIFVQPLVTDRYGIVAAKGHPAFAAKQLSIRSLAAWDYIGVPLMGELSGIVEATLKPRIRLNNMAAVVPLLEDGAGVSIFPFIGAQRVLNQNLQFRPFDKPKLSRRVCLVRRRDRSLSPAAQALWDLLESAAPSLLARHLPVRHAGFVVLP